MKRFIRNIAILIFPFLLMIIVNEIIRPTMLYPILIFVSIGLYVIQRKRLKKLNPIENTDKIEPF